MRQRPEAPARGGRGGLGGPHRYSTPLDARTTTATPPTSGCVGNPPAGTSLLAAVRQVAKRCNEERRRVITAGGVDQSTLDLLVVLRQAGPPFELAPGEIARRALVTPGAISRRPTRAEHAGLVERGHVPGDRHHVVRLLPAGRDVVDGLVGRVAELDGDLLSVLDSDQRRTLERLLLLVLEDIEDRYGTVAGTSEDEWDAHRPRG